MVDNHLLVSSHTDSWTHSGKTSGYQFLITHSTNFQCTSFTVCGISQFKPHIAHEKLKSI